MITHNWTAHMVDSNSKQGYSEAGCDNLQTVVYSAAVAVF